MNTHSSITLELNSASATPISIEAHKGDYKSRFIDISLTDNGSLVTLTSAMTAIYDATTNGIIVADGLSATVNSVSNTITIELTENMLSLSGVMKIDIKVKEGNSLITAQTFRVRVARSVIDENSKFEPQGHTIQQQFDSKADADSVYSKEEVDNTQRRLSDRISDVANQKADKAETLEGYGIADAYTKSEIDTQHNQINTSISSKANKATTLSGYGITDAYTKAEVKTRYSIPYSVLFDKDYKPLKTASNTSLSAGFATGRADVVFAFIPSTVKSISAGAFIGCTALTDVYIDNSGNNISISAGAFPDSVRLHYTDDFNASAFFVNALMSLSSAFSDYYTKTEADTLLESKENKSLKVSGIKQITDENKNYPSISYLNGYYYTYDEVDDMLDEKADLELVNQKADSSLFMDKSKTQQVKLKNFETDVNGLHISVVNNHIHVTGSCTKTTTVQLTIEEGITEFAKDMEFIVSLQNVENHIASKTFSIYLWGTYATSYQIIQATNVSRTVLIDTSEPRNVNLRLNIPANEYDKEFDLMIEKGTVMTAFEPYYVVKHTANSSISYDSLTQEMQTLINGKVNSADLISGSGTFRIESEGASEYVQGATFEYTRIGKQVTVVITVTFSEGTIGNGGYIAFSGLPVKSNDSSIGNRLVVTTTKKSQFETRITGTWLSILALTNTKVSNDEVLKFCTTYITA